MTPWPDRAKGESRDRNSTAGASAASIADPVSVGIAKFAMTTFVLSRVNAGWDSAAGERAGRGLCWNFISWDDI
jgi:succinate-acetate transporter protein